MSSITALNSSLTLTSSLDQLKGDLREIAHKKGAAARAQAAGADEALARLEGGGAYSIELSGKLDLMMESQERDLARAMKTLGFDGADEKGAGGEGGGRLDPAPAHGARKSGLLA